MKKLSVMQKMINSGVIAVVRAENWKEALRIAESVKAGGIKAIEVTMTVPGALEAIEELSGTYTQEQLIIGAGTVLDAETARAAILAGAEFIVSPALNIDLVKMCNRYQKVSMPGAMSIGEIIEVMEAGGDFVKFFPGSAFGPEIIKAIKGPLPYAPLVPTGGVSLANIADWIKAGCEAVGIGGELTKGAKTGDYDLITNTAKSFVEAVSNARS